MAEGPGSPESFCLLLWVGNGGSVNSRGMPVGPSAVDEKRIVEIDDEELELDMELSTQAANRGERRPQRHIRGLCSRPEDCAGFGNLPPCDLFMAELAKHPPETVSWVCPSCLPALLKEAKEHGVRLALPGHYNEGYCQYKHCERPPLDEMMEGLPGIPTGEIAERPARYSRYLQLVLGPTNF